ncbi:hypothetical protein C8Q78DRAFT_763734 [Trametes maxima]|nr:hypothetical protein C8Q78DRAFT_763734 [Trametes maxima]
MQRAIDLLRSVATPMKRRFLMAPTTVSWCGSMSVSAVVFSCVSILLWLKWTTTDGCLATPARLYSPNRKQYESLINLIALTAPQRRPSRLPSRSPVWLLGRTEPESSPPTTTDSICYISRSQRRCLRICLSWSSRSRSSNVVGCGYRPSTFSITALLGAYVGLVYTASTLLMLHPALPRVETQLGHPNISFDGVAITE